jgi:hypothetical protein
MISSTIPRSVGLWGPRCTATALGFDFRFKPLALAKRCSATCGGCPGKHQPKQLTFLTSLTNGDPRPRPNEIHERREWEPGLFEPSLGATKKVSCGRSPNRGTRTGTQVQVPQLEAPAEAEEPMVQARQHEAEDTMAPARQHHLPPPRHQHRNLGNGPGPPRFKVYTGDVLWAGCRISETISSNTSDRNS